MRSYCHQLYRWGVGESTRKVRGGTTEHDTNPLDTGTTHAAQRKGLMWRRPTTLSGMEKNYEHGRTQGGTTSKSRSGNRLSHVSTNIYIFSNNRSKLSTTLCAWLRLQCLQLLCLSMSHYTWLLRTSTRMRYYSATYYTPTKGQEATTWSWRTTADSLRNVNGFATPMVISTGRNYNYIVQMLTPHYFEHQLVDATVDPWRPICRHSHHYNTCSRGVLPVTRATTFI